MGLLVVKIMHDQIGLHCSVGDDLIDVNDDPLIKGVRRASIDMLARREHSAKELEHKLERKFSCEKTLIIEILNSLQSEGLQSDLRFAEGYIRWRAEKGFGFNRIVKELAQKGVKEPVIEQACASLEIDWLQILSKQYNKKYKYCQPASFEEKAKCQRFFINRGFSHSQISSLIK